MFPGTEEGGDTEEEPDATIVLSSVNSEFCAVVSSFGGFELGRVATECEGDGGNGEDAPGNVGSDMVSWLEIGGGGDSGVICGRERRLALGVVSTFNSFHF